MTARTISYSIDQKLFSKDGY